MAKKDFSNILDGVMGKTEEPAAAAAPIKEEPKVEAQEKKQPPVFSFRINPETADKIKDYAYTKRISIKEAVEIMVEAFIDDYQADPNNEPLLNHRR